MENKTLHTCKSWKSISQSDKFIETCPIPHQRLNFQILPKTWIWPNAYTCVYPSVVRGLNCIIMCVCAGSQKPPANQREKVGSVHPLGTSQYPGQWDAVLRSGWADWGETKLHVYIVHVHPVNIRDARGKRYIVHVHPVNIRDARGKRYIVHAHPVNTCIKDAGQIRGETKLH